MAGVVDAGGPGLLAVDDLLPAALVTFVRVALGDPVGAQPLSGGFSGMQVVRAIGGRAPLHLTSSGKLFLALDDPRLIRAYATRTGLAGHTRNSLTDIGKLERELSMVRTRGYARDNEELEVGVRCIAAGIRDDSGRLVAGLSVSAPAERMQDEWIAELLQTAGRISAGLGFVSQPSEGPPA